MEKDKLFWCDMYRGILPQMLSSLANFVLIEDVLDPEINIDSQSLGGGFKFFCSQVPVKIKGRFCKQMVHLMVKITKQQIYFDISPTYP